MYSKDEAALVAGVLREKKKGEDILKSSGLPYTIVRPGRLTDGPYTSFDLNTLLKATSGARQGVKLSEKDDLQEEASRIAVAGANPDSEGLCFFRDAKAIIALYTSNYNPCLWR